MEKNLPANAGGMGLITGLGRYPGEENGSLLQCSCLENNMERGAWRVTVHGIAKSRTRLSDKHLLSTLTSKEVTHCHLLLAYIMPAISFFLYIIVVLFLGNSDILIVTSNTFYLSNSFILILPLKKISLGAGEEGDGRGRDGWMVSLTQWT